MLLRSVRLLVATLAVVIATIFVVSSYVNKTPAEVTKKVVCEVAPCIMADEVGHAILLTDGGKIRPSKGDLFIMMLEGKAVVMIRPGYFLADLTAVETADWESISMYLNNGKLTQCSGGRGYRLNEAQLRRLTTLKDIDMVQAKADPNGFCSRIWQLVQD